MRLTCKLLLLAACAVACSDDDPDAGTTREDATVPDVRRDAGSDGGSARDGSADAASAADAGDGSVADAGDAGSGSVDKPHAYSVGGKISGAFAGLVLVLNDRVQLVIPAAAESYKFDAALVSGAAYTVGVFAQPGHSCRVIDASGTVAAADVTTVQVVCETENQFEVEPLFNAVLARWDDTGATDYTLRMSSAADCIFEHGSCPDFREIAHATPPLHITGLSNGTAYYFDLKAAYASEITLHARSAARPNAPVFDGDVRALAIGADDTTYVGGTFSQLRVHTGAASALHPDELPNFPIVEGDVYALAQDDAGGYYVGGSFTRVAAEARANLAHVKADGSVDASFDPGANGAVRVLEYGEGTLYVAGAFTTIGNQARQGLAELDATGVVSVWAPNPNGSVTALKRRCYAEPIPCDIVVGGSFVSIAGMPRANLALLGADGALKMWAPEPDAAVDAIAISNQPSSRVFVAGRFQNIAGQARKYLAALHWDGSVDPWAPALDGRVSALDQYTTSAESVLYLAGAFTTYDGVNRSGLAAVDLRDESLRSWNPQPSPSGSVRAVHRVADTVYLGGTFNVIANTPRSAAAAVSSREAALLDRWNPNPDGPVNAFSGSLMGGEFQGQGGVARAHLAAFAPTGEISAWNPGANASVETLVLSNNTLYVGGAFGQLAGEERNHIGAIDTSGLLKSWNADADDNVYALALVGPAVVAGGAFTEIGGAERSHVAALDAQGHAIAWGSELDGDVRALLIHGSTVFVAGDFSRIGSDARRGIAALDNSGAATAWDAGSDGAVHALALLGDKLVVAGSFTDIGDAPRSRLVALELDTALATSWAPAPDRAVRALAVADDTLYVAGNFASIDAAQRTRLAAYNTSFTLDADYAPAVDGEVRALAVSASRLVLGGRFEHIGVGFASRFGFAVKP